jgi:hypothetical protein
VRLAAQSEASVRLAAQSEASVRLAAHSAGDQFLPAVNFVTIERKSSVWKDWFSADRA